MVLRISRLDDQPRAIAREREPVEVDVWKVNCAAMRRPPSESELSLEPVGFEIDKSHPDLAVVSIPVVQFRHEDPVVGRTVLVTPSGPRQADAVTATEASPGRYRAPFAALDAGAWQLVISLDGASAAYALDVTR